MPEILLPFLDSPYITILYPTLPFLCEEMQVVHSKGPLRRRFFFLPTSALKDFVVLYHVGGSFVTYIVVCIAMNVLPLKKERERS